MIAYGNASKSVIERINVVSRAILRLILGSRASTPTQVIYAESGVTPVRQRRSWLAANYLKKLSHNPNNSTYESAYKIFHGNKDWPLSSTPCVAYDLQVLKRFKLKFFSIEPDYNQQVSIRSPSEAPVCETLWFPMSKRRAVASRSVVMSHFQELVVSLPSSALLIYTDGSLSQEKERSSCVVFIPSLNISRSRLLKKESSVFSAELNGIRQALQIVYDMDSSSEEIVLFSDSKASIQAVLSHQQTRAFRRSTTYYGALRLRGRK